MANVENVPMPVMPPLPTRPSMAHSSSQISLQSLVTLDSIRFDSKEDRDILKSRRTAKDGISNTRTLMSLMKGLVGTGILSLPVAFYNAGIWTAIGLTIVIIFVSIHCMEMVVKGSHYFCKLDGETSLDYADVAERSVRALGNNSSRKLNRLGIIFAQLINFFIGITQLGFCCVYFIFMASNIKQVTDMYIPTDPLDIRVYIALLLPAVIAICMIRQLKTLALLSMFSNFLYIVGFIITFQYIFRDLFPISEIPGFQSFSTLPLFFGTVMFAFEAISLVLPLENKMTHPQDFVGWTGVLNTGCLIVLALYLAVGFFGYLKFGSMVATQGTITLNLPNDDPLYQSVKIIFSVAILITYALQFYVPIELFRGWLKKSRPEKEKANLFIEIGVRIILVIITFGMAELIPHVDLFISLVGSLMGAGLSMVFPPIIHICMLWPARHLGSFGRGYWVMLKDVLIILFGLVGFATGTWSSIRDIVNTF